jgi:hypothetical protein
MFYIFYLLVFAKYDSRESIFIICIKLFYAHLRIVMTHNANYILI